MELIRKRWPVFLLILLPLVTLYRAVLLGEAIGPFDDVRAMMGGEITPRAFDVLQTDAVLQFYVWRDLVFESWGRFEAPFWNHYQLMGTPLLANSQSAGFYPLHIVAGVLQIPTAFAIALLAWFHLAWAGLGVRFLSKRLGASEYGATAAGVMFGISPFMLSWVGLCSVITTVAWIPWALGLIHVVFWGKSSARTVVLLAICLAMMFLGGHLQFAAYGGMAVVLTTVWYFFAQREGVATFKRGLIVIAALAVGSMLAAPQILPILEFNKNNHRQSVATPEGYEGYISTSVKTFQLSGLAFPGVLGTPGASIDADSIEPLPNYWPGYIKRGANFAESAMYLGPVCLLLLAGLVRRRDWRMAGATALVGLFGFLLAMGTPLNKLLYFYMPGWAASGSPGRAVVLFMIGACVLASLGWPDKDTEQKSLKMQGVIGFALIASTLLIASWAMSNLEVYAEEYAAIWQVARGQAFANALPSILLLSGLAVLIGIGWQKKRPDFALAALCAGQLLLGGPGLIPTSSNPWEPGTPDPNTRIAFINEQWGLKVGVPVSYPPNVPAGHRLYDIGGYDSLMDLDTRKHLTEINGQDPAPPANGNIMFTKPSADRNLLAESGVTEVWSLDNYAMGAKGVLIKEKIGGPGRATLDGRSVQILEDTFTSQTLKLSGPGRLKVRDRNLAGWTATIDGEETELQESFWREIDLPEGEHDVKFKYTPPGLKKGLLFFVLGALASIAGLALTRSKNGEQPSP